MDNNLEQHNPEEIRTDRALDVYQKMIEMTDKLITIKESELHELLSRLDFLHDFYSGECAICETGNNGQACDDLCSSIVEGIKNDRRV